MTRFNFNRRSVLGGAGALAAAATLGIKPEQVLGAEGGVLKVRMVGDIQVLDPGYMIGGAETTTLFACMPRLAEPVFENGTWNWKPSEYVDKVGQDDETHISFTLKPGLMWSGDIGELTAEDVKYSLERMLKSDWSARFPTLDHVDIKDKYSGVIVLKAPFAGTWLMGIASESGSILPKAAMVKLKDEKFTTELPGSLGPYMLASWTPKQKLVLKADPNWKGTKPDFDEIQILDIEDGKAAELAFEAKEIALASIPTETAARYSKTPPANSKLVKLPSPLFTWLGCNTQNPKFADIKVRKAIQRAVDLESVLVGAYGGIASAAHGVVPDGILGHRDKSKYAYNPDEAKDLLKQAGVSDLAVDIKVLSGETAQVTAGQIIQANLNDVGMKATVSTVDSGPYWNLGLESKGDAWKTLELWLMRFRCSPDPADAMQWFKKDQVGVWNWERWTDAEFEKLWEDGLKETDPAKRAPIYQRMQEIMEDTGAYTWITFDPWDYASSTDINPGFDPGGEIRAELIKKA